MTITQFSHFFNYVRKNNGNGFDFGPNKEKIEHYIEEKVIKEANRWFVDNLENQKISIGGNEEAIIKDIGEVYINFPWHRFYDITIDPSIVLK